jgi:Zn-dependent M28 family amino/carboxypeptidase
MLWGGEEQGLLGSSAYCKAHQDEMERTSACFVHDGGTNYVSGIGVTEPQREDFEQVFAPVLNLHEERPFKIRTVGSLRGGASDHGSFLAQNVPGYFWDQSGRSVYGYGWHTQNDTYNIAIPEYQSHTATIAAVAAYQTANLKNLISREDMRSTGERPMQNRTLGVQFPGDGPAMRVEEVVDGGTP